jgi:hypothetical protein
MDNPELNEEIRKGLKAFYGVLKTADPALRFAFLTGVTKFSQVSVFSDLNQLRDISLDEAYAELCGISERELTENFEIELQALAEKNRMNYEEALEGMRKRFNGYHFSGYGAATGVYNPFSVLNTFASGRFQYYWFQTGTPTFLIKLLQKADFDLRSFAGGLSIAARSINDYRIQGGSPLPILYQSGYLTITGYDREMDEYLLGFPNEEVEYGFLEALIPYYVPTPGNDFFIGDFARALVKGDVDGFMTRLKAFFAAIPYELNDKTERHYQAIFYVVFTLLGQYTATGQWKKRCNR